MWETIFVALLNEACHQLYKMWFEKNSSCFWDAHELSFIIFFYCLTIACWKKHVNFCWFIFYKMPRLSCKESVGSRCDDVLHPIVLLFMQHYLPHGVFQHGNRWPHTTWLITDFLCIDHVNVIDWSSLSPDLAPIENLLDELLTSNVCMPTHTSKHVAKHTSTTNSGCHSVNVKVVTGWHLLTKRTYAQLEDLKTCCIWDNLSHAQWLCANRLN